MDGSRRFKWRGSVNKIARKFGQGTVSGNNPLLAFGSHLEDIQASPNNPVRFLLFILLLDFFFEIFS